MAECLIHTASTVGIQAFFMKKNVISFVPDIKGSHRGFSNQFGVVFNFHPPFYQSIRKDFRGWIGVESTGFDLHRQTPSEWLETRH